MGLYVRDVDISGFLGGVRNQEFALNAKVRIGTGPGGKNDR